MDNLSSIGDITDIVFVRNNTFYYKRYYRYCEHSNIVIVINISFLLVSTGHADQ